MLRLIAFALLFLMLATPVYADETAAPAKPSAEAPLDQASMDDKALTTWATGAATDAMTFGFNDFQTRFEQSARYFTKKGWESFSGQLQRTHRFDAMRKANQMITASPAGKAVIESQAAQDGTYQWVVKLPLTLSEKTEDDTNEETIRVRLVIQRVPTNENPNGVAITEWSAL